MSVLYCNDCDIHVDTDFNVEHFNADGKCARHYLPDGSRIVTSHDRPPVPTTAFDWSACSENFDAELIDGRYVSNMPVGYGPTEQAAIDDLLEQYG